MRHTLSKITLGALFGSLLGPASAASYNINWAGGEDVNVVTVADGTTLSAPSSGTNVWNNIIVPIGEGDVLDPDPALALLNTAGADEGVTIDWSGFTDDNNAQSTNGVSGIFEGYFGKGGFDTTFNVDGLDSGSSYDVFVYFTWGWNEGNSVDYELTHDGGPETKSLTPAWATAQNGNQVEDVNYVVFSGVSPTVDGSLDLRAFNTADGGISGIQISEVPEPSVALLGALGVLGLLRRRR